MAYKDRETARAAVRRHYRENRQYYIDKAKKRRGEILAYIRSHKVECCRCGFNVPAALDFHHREDKSFNLGEAHIIGYSIEKVDAEIAKCFVLCANCHRIETAEVW